MTTPRLPPPPVEIPESQNTVEVYIIGTTSFMSGLPSWAFVEPVPPGFETLACRSYAFLIRNRGRGDDTKYDTVLFDLGVRKDWENSPPAFVQPSPYTPLPESIAPSPLGLRSCCPNHLFLSAHPQKDPTAPFFHPATRESWHSDAVLARRTIERLAEADAYDNIFPVLAHDITLIDVVDLYPKPANAWMANGWKKKTR